MGGSQADGKGGPEAQGVLIVMQTPKEGRVQEHTDWYLEHHLRDVAGVPGVIRGEFMAVVPGTPDPRWTHAACYWLSSDPSEATSEVLRRAGSGEWTRSDTLDRETMAMLVGEALTERRRAPGSEDAGPDDRLVYIVLTNSTPGDDDTFNAWYSDTHINDVLDIPGFVAAQRFRLVEHPSLPQPPFGYAALYEVRKDAADAAFAELAARAGTERMVLSPTLDRNGLHAAPFSAQGFRVGAAAAA